MKKLKTLKGILAFSIMLFTFMNAAAQPAITETGLSQTVENGAIFHAWCWSFNTIKANLSEIAAAGFSAVQTSPVSQCLVGEDGGLEIFGNGKWYYHYQCNSAKKLRNIYIYFDKIVFFCVFSCYFIVFQQLLFFRSRKYKHELQSVLYYR